MLRRFNKFRKRHQLVFSLIELSALVCLWRGIWGLMDLYFFAHDPAMSYTFSIAIGATVVVITHFMVKNVK